MATYCEITEWVKKNLNCRGVKSCYIADVKERCHILSRQAWNRQNPRKNPCPDDKVEPIKCAFKHFKMI